MANAPKIPTLADLDALPHGSKGEIIEGVLYAMTRPRSPHPIISGTITSELTAARRLELVDLIEPKT